VNDEGPSPDTPASAEGKFAVRAQDFRSPAHIRLSRRGALSWGPVGSQTEDPYTAVRHWSPRALRPEPPSNDATVRQRLYEMAEWLVFLCYRQTDGAPTAEWLNQILKGQKLYSEASEEPPTLAVYFDVAAPAVSDWHEFHGRALERARALLVVCTPGSAHEFGANDEVHKEIDWWLKNRKTAPILIDATGEGQRWVPEKIQQRWPYAQLVKVDLRRSLPEPEAVQTITRRILDGICTSERAVNLEDHTKHMARALVERAERAVADREELTADVLLAHAVELDRSEDIRDHFLAHMSLKPGTPFERRRIWKDC
jgi:hypothetical protein